MLQTQLTVILFFHFICSNLNYSKAIKIKMDNLEKHNELILRQRNELTKLLLSQSDRTQKQDEQ